MLSSIKDKLERFFPSGDLYERTVKSGLWMGGIRLFTRGFGLLKIIIVARFLAPHDFGLFGIAMLSMAVLHTFSQPGFRAKLIQKKENIEKYLDTAWVSFVLRGAAIFGILWFTSPYIAGFFDNPAASPLIKAVGFVAFLRGIKNVGIVYFRKELEFHKQFAYQFGVALTGLSVTVVLAVLWGSVWALLVGSIAGSLVGFALSFVLHPYRPSLNFDLDKAKEMFGYGKWIMGSSVLVFLITQGDDIFVGKVLGAASLGLYQMAYRVSNSPATEITHTISNVTFPAYSKVQDNMEKLRNGYLKTLKIITFVSFPMALGIIAVAPYFTKAILGPDWISMVPALQILALWGLIRSLGATTGPVFKAVGRPDIATKIQFLKLVLLILMIYPLSSRYGIAGTSFAVLVNAFVAVPIASYRVIKITNTRVKEFLNRVGIPLIVSGLMLGTLFLVNNFVLDTNSLSTMVIMICLGVVMYLSGTFITERISDYDALREIRQVVKSLSD